MRSDIETMRHRGAILCALISFMAALRADAQTSLPPRPETVPLFPTRQAVFDIPFQIDAPIPGQEPVEVQLHVSEDRGATWKAAVKAKPTDGKFTYQAPRDGEFWFLVRTLNRAGRLVPEKPPAPELRVLVDTMPPAIELQVAAGTSGELVCTWKLSDPNLQPETLALSYQGVDAAAGWKTIDASTSQAGPDGSYAGRATFTPTGMSPPYFVRAEVSDAAGNRAAAQQQFTRPGEVTQRPTSLPSTSADTSTVDERATRPLSQSSSSAQVAPPASPGSPMGRSWPSVATPLPQPVVPPREAIGAPRADGSVEGYVGGPPNMPRSFPGRVGATPGESLPPGSSATSPYTSTSTPQREPSLSGGARGPEQLPIGEPEQLPTPDAQGPISSAGTGGDPSRRVTTSPRSDLPGSSSTPPSSDAAGPSFGGGLPTPTSPAPIPTPEAFEVAKPAGVQPRMVNSRRFELDYDVEAVGPAGVAKVELWQTDDEGKNWQMAGVDPDSVSPYIVDVTHEGIYGFRMVIETTTGLRSAQPQPGDLPEVWVGIDVTKPQATIKGALPGTGLQAGELIIEWEASDSGLLPRPIALSFAEQMDGPWTPIASGLPNDGRYAWRLDNRVPEQLYLKLDVRDEAGNVATYITPERVSLLRVKPQGKIRGVRPIGESAQLRLPAEISPR